MKDIRKVFFVTGTRADFGKLKPLMKFIEQHEKFEAHILVTGMHMMRRYGYTANEIKREALSNVYYISNQYQAEPMCSTLGNTVSILSRLFEEVKPDLVVVHGDRLEALAGSTVGALSNRLVCHIEGGEVSGTIDDLIRHSVSKISHIHMVANEEAKSRLLQMGEAEGSIFIIGSPDLDVMASGQLPTLDAARSRYDITFDDYAIAMFHPVTTEETDMFAYAQAFFGALIDSGDSYVVVYPNNDLGSDAILDALEMHRKNPRLRIFPSIRFEHFLVLLKNARYIIGNSSAGIREAPFYGVPTINVGSRQNCRFTGPSILNCGYDGSAIRAAIETVNSWDRPEPTSWFGDGDSVSKFAAAVDSESFWKIPVQKTFVDIR